MYIYIYIYFCIIIIIIISLKTSWLPSRYVDIERFACPVHFPGCPERPATTVSSPDQYAVGLQSQQTGHFSWDGGQAGGGGATLPSIYLDV